MSLQNISFDLFPLDVVAVYHKTNSTPGGIVSDEITDIFTTINFATICFCVAIFGSAANILNITVFVKQGSKDPVTLTLLALAVSDFGCCFSLIWLTICYNPSFLQLDLPFDPTEIQYLSAGWIHNIFTRITSCITAFITFERCLCVASPLKVNAIITPTRVKIFLTIVVIFIVAFVAPTYYTSRYVWEFNQDKNKTMLNLVFLKEYEQLNATTYYIHSIFLPMAAFSVVLVSTIVLVVNLQKKAKWRENVTITSKSLSTRDARVSKMVVMVATLFIFCFVPAIVSFAFMATIPEFSLIGRYKNVFLIVFSYHFTLEAINSSLNIFIYYRMSSNYRTVFDHLYRKNLITKDKP